MSVFVDIEEANREITRLREFIKTGYLNRHVDFNAILKDLVELGVKDGKIREITGIGYEAIQNAKSGRSKALKPQHANGEKLINLWALVSGNCIYEVPRK